MKFLLFIAAFAISIPLEAQEQEQPISNVETMPSFPGGLEKMYKFIYGNLTYPDEALRKKITGSVVLQFVVSAEGEIEDIKVMRGIGYGCDEEAVRVVELMNEENKWIPGTHNGRAVPVTFTLPIKFHLQ